LLGVLARSLHGPLVEWEETNHREETDKTSDSKAVDENDEADKQTDRLGGKERGG
jgi:hypothetical protein